MMKKLCWVLCILAVSAGFALEAPGGQNEITQLPHCPICGMDRLKFAHSRMVIVYEDGSRFGSCSLHCTALELAYHPGKVPVSIAVGDFGTHLLIQAGQAAWILGGDQRGVMTLRAKWAFAKDEDARKFIAKHGGKLVDFETAMAAAYSDMYEDTLMIRKKRKKINGAKTK